MAAICLVVPILLLLALIGLGRYEDRLLSAGAPISGGGPPDDPAPALPGIE